jgi:Aerotolerance regulator N-terminal/von Willebrand factor type A domain
MFSSSSLPLLWALEFANPALLGGLAAASIPIVIHLLNRRKFREISWAAMQFLMAAIRKNQRRVRIEQWLLLAVRTLLLLLIVAAMAKPFLESFGNVIGDRRTHRVLVLDNSLSMGYATGDKSRFDQAKDVATQLVKDSRQGDAISLITMGAPPKVIIAAPQTIQAEVQKEIAELTMTHGSTDLLATFEKIDQVLDVSTIPQKEIFFLTDLQSTSWRRPEASGKDGLDRVLAKLEARKPRSVIIDLGKVGSENRAVTDLKVDSPVVTVGSTPLVQGVIRNFGPSKADGVLVRLIMDGRISSEQAVDLPVGEDVPVIFNQPFTTTGDHVVELSLDNDALPLDDHRWLVVPVRESLNVLLVDGHFRSEPFQAETDYLAQALMPSEESPGQPGMIHAEVVTESQFKSLDLTRFDVVALCNVGQFVPSYVAALEDYLNQGGGLIIFGGDQVMADNYNRLLHADGKGLLPAALGVTVGDAAKKEAAFAFNPLGYRHPLLAEFRGESLPVMAGLTQTRIWQYHKLTKLDSKAQVAMAFDSNDPAIIEAPWARGKVILVATSADADWNTWPLHSSYPPIMLQMILQAASGRLAERNIRVGQPYNQSFGAAGTAAAATVTNPKGQPVAARLKAAGGNSELHFEQTELSGRYQVQIGPPLTVENAFAADSDPAESDLAKLDRSRLEQRLPGWRFDILPNSPELSQSAAAVSHRGELHRPMLYGALVLLLLETFLAWKFGHHEPSS